MNSFEILVAYGTWKLRFYYVSYWIVFLIIVFNGYSSIARIGTKCPMHTTVLCYLNTVNRFIDIVIHIFRLIVWSMILYLYYYVSTGKFRLHFFHKSVGSILKDYDCCFLRILHIHIHYDNEDDLERDRDQYQKIYTRLQFHLGAHSDLVSESVMPDDNLSIIEPLISSSRPTIYIEDEIRPKRLKTIKRNPAGPERPVSNNESNVTISSINDVDRRFICPLCQCVFREPCQLSCGHHVCRSCLQSATESVILLKNNEMSFPFLSL